MEIKDNQCKWQDGCMKYAVIFVGTIIGAFLAFYFVVDVTINNLLSPEHQMKKAEKMMKNMDREFDRSFRDIHKDIDVFGKMMPPNPVSIAENSDNYEVTVALKPFGNSSKDVKVKVEDNVLKIEGSHDVKKGDRENMMSFNQSYLLQHKVNNKKITTKEDKGKYIVTIPFDEK